jgi:hypothetical protein
MAEKMPRRMRGKSGKSLELIGAAHKTLAEIQPATVRAVCYRLFTIGLIPDMSKSSTNRVSKQLVYAREQGMIPWEWVVDETREAERTPSWDNPDAFARAVQLSYRRNRWAQQPRQIEVWSEKGTVRGTLAPVLDKYGVTFRVLHGYSSATVVNQVADETSSMDEPLLVLYVGDWDPSGLHMSEVDLPRRLLEYGASVEIVRVALTRDHVANRGLPSFEASTKRQDPRWRWYVQRYGRLCWELDALSPVVLREAVENHIVDGIDSEYWERCEHVERAERESLMEVMGSWKALISRQA